MTGFFTVLEVRTLRVHNVPTVLKYCREVCWNIHEFFHWRRRYKAFMTSEKCHPCVVRDSCYENGQELPKDRWCP